MPLDHGQTMLKLQKVNNTDPEQFYFIELRGTLATVVSLSETMSEDDVRSLLHEIRLPEDEIEDHISNAKQNPIDRVTRQSLLAQF